jgi:lipopolysaccharide transport system ATP-binding protein
MTPIIKVEGLGKRYSIGKSVAYRTLRDDLASAAGASMRLARDVMRKRGAESARARPQVWALRDVSFEVMPGEVLGVIGGNGAGKSTLLKILSRITQPTEGRAELRGRVGSLLEVGTGFHPELSGRENIFLSGAILGMRRSEIIRKLDEIIAFSEIDKFVDTPVKRYSSGMYMRLAFAVAAHLETEILLVDEVLAVGDVTFQKKCLGKIGDVAKEGRTVLFVSHNLASVETLCSRCALFKGGRLGVFGTPADAISQYLHGQVIDTTSANASSLVTHRGRRSYARTMMTAVNLDADESAQVTMGGRFSVAVSFVSEPDPIAPVLGLVFRTVVGAPVFTVNNKFIAGYVFVEQMGSGTITCTIDSIPLVPGTYSLDLYFGDSSRDYDIVDGALKFEVIPADIFGTGKLPSPQCGPTFASARFSVEDKVNCDADFEQERLMAD